MMFHRDFLYWVYSLCWTCPYMFQFHTFRVYVFIMIMYSNLYKDCQASKLWVFREFVLSVPFKLILKAPITTIVLCLNILEAAPSNSVDPDQTAPI